MRSNEEQWKNTVHASRNSLLSDVVKRFVRNRAAMLGLLILTLVIFVIIFADVLAPASLVTAYNTKEKFQGPSARHWFGTDNLGRDMLARVMHGARISVGIGVGATMISLILGAILAAICALSKKADFVIMRVMDVGNCIPSVLLALVLLAIMGGSVANMMVTLTIVSVPGFVVRIRSVLLGLVEQDYVKAARLSGTRTAKLVLRHILPNAMAPVIVDATMTVSSMMLSAAGLSFIGMGVSPPSPEWGAMLNNAQRYFRTSFHMALFPGLAIALTALSINLVGDGLRDALDPKSLK